MPDISSSEWSTTDDLNSLTMHEMAGAIKRWFGDVDGTTVPSGGTTGQVLAKASNTDFDTTWSTLAAAGKLRQAQQGTRTSRTTSTSATFADTGLSVTITPSATTSKILILVCIGAVGQSVTSTETGFRLLRDATGLLYGDAGGTGIQVTCATWAQAGTSAGAFISYLDSPSTTSATTYKVQWANLFATGTVYFNSTSQTTNANYPLAGSSIIALEIGA